DPGRRDPGARRRGAALPANACRISQGCARDGSRRQLTGDELRSALDGLARNLAYAWSPRTRALFRELDPVDWHESDHNPIVLLGGITDDRLERAAEDAAYCQRVEAAQAALADELAQPAWWDGLGDAPEDFLVAYFSTEFALDESIPIYSGGLGVL